jgi:predicted transcriptional regulator
MKLNTTLIVTQVTDNCREEFQYLYVWYEPYKVVDASYLVLSNNKESALKSIEDFVYKLWYINPDCSYIDIVSHIVEIINKRSSKGIYVTETDVYNLVFKIMNSKLPSDISNLVTSKFKNGSRVETTKIVEWKSNVSGLLVLDDNKMKRIRMSKNIELELSKEYKKIKLRYMKKCIDKVNRDNHQDLVESTIDMLRDTQSEASVNEISFNCGLSYTTTRKYIDLMADRLNFIEGFKVIKDKNKEMSNDTIKRLIKTKENMKSDGIRVNKTNLCRESGISRPTIDKYWNIIK